MTPVEISFNPKNISNTIERKVLEDWHLLWSNAASRDLKVDISIDKSDFLKNDLVCAIFDKDKMQTIGLSLYRFSLLNKKTIEAESYFNCWSNKGKKEALSYGPTIIIGTYFIVSPEYRAQRYPFKWKDEVMKFAMMELLKFDFNSAVISPRVDRSMNLLAKKFGGVIVEENILNSKFQALQDHVVLPKENIQNSLFNKANQKIAA